MKLLRHPKPVASSNASNGTTRPNMPVGSTWPSPNSASSHGSVLIAAFPTCKPSSLKSPLGNPTVTNTTPKPTGSSHPPMLASNSSSYTPCFKLTRGTSHVFAQPVIPPSDMLYGEPVIHGC